MQGQKACNDAGSLAQAASFTCINPFYAEPLCVSACIITCLLTTAAAWLVKDEDTPSSSSSNYSASNTNVRYRSTQCHTMSHNVARNLSCAFATGGVPELQRPAVRVAASSLRAAHSRGIKKLTNLISSELSTDVTACFGTAAGSIRRP